MSGLDPLAALSARVAAVEAAMLEAAINLGVSAELLQAQVGTGDILAAKVLPPQNGQDLIEILGQRVAAQLPPGIHPGETLQLQVTGFSGTQIFVRNLGTIQTENETAPQAPAPPQISPPRAVFVAASVQQAPQVRQTEMQPIPARAAAMQGVEARIAAAQTAKLPPNVTSVTIAPSARQQPPQHTTPLIPARSVPAVPHAAATAVQRPAQTVSEFLRAARLPDTPSTRMAAAIAPHAPERLPSVLQRLEAALPRAADDPRVSTLRTLIGFTARINPANAGTLAAQISAYVSNVIQGAEAKLAQLLQAHAQAAAQPAAPPEAPAVQPSAVPQASTPQSSDPLQPPSPAIAQARVAERAAAISHDLKSVVLSLLRDPPSARTPAMTQALSETLITLTGVQVNALSANQQDPGTFTFTLPVYYHEGGKPAQIRISRDAQSRAAKMDADNFHVAFVLDTANLGTVAIDLQTAGRTVKLDVKTENTPAAARFSDTLSSLRNRLEDLSYRVSTAVARALPSAGAASNRNAAAQNDTPNTRKRGLDLQA